MRDFSWTYFTLTGDVESFMLYKEMDQFGAAEQMNQTMGTSDAVASSEDETII